MAQSNNELAEVMACIAAYQAMETGRAVREHAEAVGMELNQFCEFQEWMSR